MGSVPDREERKPGAKTRSGRLQITFGEDTQEKRPSSTQGIRLKTAALMLDGSRIPIPRSGCFLGTDGSVAVEAGSHPAAEVLPTDDGFALKVTDDRLDVFLNGERLVSGERRPLTKADSIAVGGRLLYFLPGGERPGGLPAIEPISGGRLEGGNLNLLVGRDPGCDIVLDYPTVSGKHALIRTVGRRTRIEDRASASGTRVNGIPVRRADLAPGDEIAIGPFRLVFDGEDLLSRKAAEGLAVEAANVTVSAGEKQILRPTSLSIRSGEFVAIIGESGAGKTTLLKALAGITTPQAGTVLCGGEPVRSRLTEVGYVPQFDIVHDDLSVEEALDFSAQLRLAPDISQADRAERVAEVIEELELSERASTRVADLSGGQRKRVAVGTELLHRPGAIFLDEPTTGLDPGLERTLMDLFSKMARGGQTVCLVTHATRSLALCDRVILMGRGGSKKFDGPPDELLEAFGVESFDDVYAQLATGTSPAPGPQQELRRKVLDFTSTTKDKQVRQSFGRQARVLATRYSLLMSRNRKHLISLVIQTALLAVLTGILFDGVVFQRPPSAENPLAGKAAQLIFLMVTIAIWLGAIGAAREIVKEKSVISREMAVGVGVNAYIFSKLLVLLALVTLQTVVFFVIVTRIESISPGSFSLLLVLVMASWLAVLTGLVVSAFASSEDQATGLIPILLVPQLLFGGALVTRAEMPSFVQTLSDLIPSRWAYEGGGTVVNLPGLINARVEGAPISSLKPLQKAYEGFFGLGVGELALVYSGFAVVLYGLLVVRLRRTAE